MNEQPTFCSYHPNRPTTLRCNRCNRPICSQCAVRTPVGYRCKTCVHEQQKIFETAFWYDFPVAFLASGLVLGVGSIASSFLGIFIVIAAGFVGSIAARVVAWAVRHRRNRYLWLAAAAGGVAGCLPVMIPPLVVMLFTFSQGGVEMLLALGSSLLWPGLYMVVAVGALIVSMKGVRLG